MTSAAFDIRYNFTGQFLMAAAQFARRAARIERQATKRSVSERSQVEHLGAVCAAVMQSVAALETEAHSIMEHGPGHHLGSNGLDLAAKRILSPLLEAIASQPVLERYELMLHVLGRNPIPRSGRLWDDAVCLVSLRNHVTHYESRWMSDDKPKNLVKKFRTRGFAVPSFAQAANVPFPRALLVADCAKWSVLAASEFLDAFYGSLGIESVVRGYKRRIAV